MNNLSENQNRHGGRVRAEVVLDSGATFYFSTPQKPEPVMDSEIINLNRKAIPDGDFVAVGIVAEVGREADLSPDAGPLL